jgi:hypothetical protein
MSSRQIPLPRNNSSIFRSGWIDNPGLLVLLVVETRPLNHLLVGISRLFLVKANIKFLGDLPICVSLSGLPGGLLATSRRRQRQLPRGSIHPAMKRLLWTITKLLRRMPGGLTPTCVAHAPNLMAVYLKVAVINPLFLRHEGE